LLGKTKAPEKQAGASQLVYRRRGLAQDICSTRRRHGATPEPTVELEINYIPHQTSISHVCGLVWNCTDIVPGLFVDRLLREGVEIQSRTYAAIARAILADIKRKIAA
jgi:hypothetical protein